LDARLIVGFVTAIVLMVDLIVGIVVSARNAERGDGWHWDADPD
jgi:hypothetical protein